MTAASHSGRADLLALVASLLLGGAALAPALALRAGPGWRKCREEALAEHPAPAPRNPVAGPLAAADGVRTLHATSAFRPDPARVPGPLPTPAAAAPSAGVRDLAGRVIDGRLHLLWRPVPGSRATHLRIEGLGGPGVLEQEVPADRESLEIPVPGASGTAVVRATPLGAPARAAEARVSVPFRIPVEVVSATAASPETGSALLVLRRAFAGRAVEGEFPVHEADVVGGLSPAGPGGPVVDFRTDLVLEKVRAAGPGGPPLEVPRFDEEGRTIRDPEGKPLTGLREGIANGTVEVVLRGPDDRRIVLRAASGGR